MQAMHVLYFMVVQELAMSINLSGAMLLLQVDDDASDYDDDECQPTGRLKACLYAGTTEALHEAQVVQRLHIAESCFPGPCRPCWTMRHQQHPHSTDA